MISASNLLFLKWLDIAVAPQLLRTDHLGLGKIFAHHLRIDFGARAAVLVKGGTLSHIISELLCASMLVVYQLVFGCLLFHNFTR